MIQNIYSNINFCGNSGINNGLTPVAPKMTPVKKITSDTFEGSNNLRDESKKTDRRGLKIFLGLCTITAITVITTLFLKNKKVKIEDVQKALSDTFGRDLSVKETEELVQRYTELYKEKGSDKYYEKLINQLKKDYGIQEVKTSVKINNTISDSLYKVAGEASRNGDISVFPENLASVGDTDGFKTLFHEVKHIRQYSELYMADKSAFAKAIAEESVKSEKNKDSISKLMNMGYTKESAEKYLYNNLYKDILKSIEKTYGKLKPFKKNSDEYKKGIEYLDSLIKNRIETPQNDTEMKLYKNLLCEKEAFACGDNAEILLRYIKQHLQ